MNLISVVERYNHNWNTVREAISNARIKPERDDLFVCPQCLRWFSREIWNQALSLEHVPPRSMGGAVRTVTCRQCNNDAGSKLDAELRKEQSLSEFFEGVPNATIEANYQLDGMTSQVIANITRPDSRTWHIIGIPERTNPAHLREIRHLPRIQKPEDFKVSLSFIGWRSRRPEIARLRIAYLWAFSIFGYSILFNRSFLTIREQIMHPEQDIVAHFPQWKSHDDGNRVFPLGVSVIHGAGALQGLLVNYSLKRPQKSVSWHMSILPKPTDQGLDNLLKVQNGERQKANLTHFPEPVFEEHPFLPLRLWGRD